MVAAKAGAVNLSCPLGRVSASREATEKGEGLVGVAARVSGDAGSGGPPGVGPGEDMSPVSSALLLHVGYCLVCYTTWREPAAARLVTPPRLGAVSPAGRPAALIGSARPCSRGGTAESVPARFHAFVAFSRTARRHILPRLSRAFLAVDTVC
ncbi:hypothetical protein MRX96_058273 [Rhipicephalus microplus]